ncbi:enoyl-CoA hydratase-related protein [Pseudorhodoplanes sp.]|uniref:enoyl-CoA hydratase-related protein n=1 Tax=Pseudorhodoplanes sp. TaxID=1934341 RepID=UPI003D11715B
MPHIALVRFNRPEVRNAINHEVRVLIDRYFRQISNDSDIRCVVLTGNDDAFAAGADIHEQAERDVVNAMSAFNSRAIMECPKPVIAAVNGFALGGGCEVVMQCDIIIANDKAKFGQPEVKLGLVPGAGGTQRLPRIIGKHHALYLLLTGNLLSAADAYRLGMVSEIVVENCERRAIEIASQVARMGPLAAQQIKEVVLAGLDAPLDAALRMERKAYQLMFGTNDLREGFEAFIEKRPPLFRGK